MSTITWLHISDLYFHVSQDRAWDSVLNNLLGDVDARIRKSGVHPDFIVVCGDVAYSGSPAEYVPARRFFDDLLEITGLDKERLFIVPGNHDVDRRLISHGARAISKSITDQESADRILSSSPDRKLLFSCFEGYTAFLSDYMDGIRGFDDERYFYVSNLDLDGRRVALAGLNTAWLAQGDGDYGELMIGERQARAALGRTEGADIKIALMHHPFYSLREFDRDPCEALMNRNFDFILHGHPQGAGLPLRQPEQSKATIIAAGGNIGAGSQSSAYNFVQLDLNAKRGRIFLRIYSNSSGGFWTRDATSFSNAPDGVYSFPLRMDWSQPSSDLPADVSAPGRIYLEKLHLKNFRCFEEDAFSFSDGFTVFIGDNGSGKTAVLEAISIGIGSFFHGIDIKRAPAIELDQARVERYSLGRTSTREPQYPVRIDCEAAWGARRLEWARTREGEELSALGQVSSEIGELAGQLQARVRKGMEVVLPVIAYYGPGRLWRAPEKRDLDPVKPGSRVKGYENCLNPASHVGGLIRWMKSQELYALQEGTPDTALSAVKQAIKNCVNDLRDIFYHVREDDIHVHFSDGRQVAFRMLSEGFRNMVAMTADIAWRAVVLNPQFEKEAALKTPGIVLIDEIDLHLHPKWQRRVVEDLRRAFPRMQFIATTHSPFIIQSLRPGELIDLKKSVSGEYANRSIEDILESVMGIELPQRGERYQQMYETAKQYYLLLREAKAANPRKKQKLKQKLDELTAPFSDNVAYHAFLEMKRIAAGVGDDNEAR